jgi:Crp-like helix-turn-helix domain
MIMTLRDYKNDYTASRVKSLAAVPSRTVQHFLRRESIPLNPNTLWRIESGVVRTATWGLDSSLIPLGLWGVDDIVGAPLSQIRPYQIDCLTDVTVCILPSDMPYPPDAMISHVQQMEELLRIMHICSIEQRLLKFLYWFANKFGQETEEGQIINVRLTHQEISEMIGSTRVTVTRLLQKFQAEKLLNWSEERYMVLEYSDSEVLVCG